MRAAKRLGDCTVSASDEAFAQTGIRTRHLESIRSVADLATEAAEQLCSLPGLTIACTATHHTLPPVSAVVCANLGLRGQHFDLNAACAGAVHALVIAADRMRADDALDQALVIGAEKFPDIDGNPFLSDGAGAILLSRSDRLRSAVFDTDTTNLAAVSLTPTGFSQDGIAVWHQAMMHMPGLIRKAVERADWGMDDVDLFVLHQANGKMLDFLRSRLKIEPERWFTNVETTGNTGSASIPIALADAYAQDRLHGKVVIAGLGAGFGFAAAAWELP
jgi:3-oxoacyl-[acyl-carrier-protein] synthase III